jgi:hypothetical protein
VDEVLIKDPNPDMGARVTLLAHVVNHGNATSSNASVEFLVDGNVVGTAPIGDLDPMEDRSVTYVWRADAPGVHPIAARIDGDDLHVVIGSVDVKEESPGPSVSLLLLALAASWSITRAARRSG